MERQSAKISRTEHPPDGTPRVMSDAVPASVAILRTSDGGCLAVSKDDLSAHSEYFDALFNRPLSNVSRGDVLIPGVSQEALQAIVTYASAGDVSITVDNVQNLTIAARQLLVDGLLSDCCAFMSGNLDVQNSISVLEMAHFFYLEPLQKQALRFVLDNFESVYSENGDFCRLSFEDLKSLLSSDELKVGREEVVWEATVFWIKASLEERNVYLGQLLQHTRFCLMKGSYLKTVVMRNPLVSENQLFQAMVERCRTMQQSEQDALFFNPSRSLFVQRVPADIMFVYGGLQGGYKSNIWDVYDHKRNEWKTVQTDFREDQVFGMQCASLGHRIYIMGADITKQCPFCYCFDAVSMKWSSVPPMNQLRAFFGIAVLDHCVYCIGGSPNGNIAFDTAERYDTVAEAWRTVGRMNHPRLGASAAACAGRVYIVGGMSNDKVLRTAEVYDPVTDKWTVVAPMRTERFLHSLVTYRGKIYVVGGVSRKSTVCEAYDSNKDKWSKVSNTNAFSDKVVAVVLDDKIYAIGETNQKDYTRCIEYFSGDDRKWHTIPGYSPPRWFYSACVLRNLPNAKDYINRPDQTGSKFTCTIQ